MPVTRAPPRDISSYDANIHGVIKKTPVTHGFYIHIHTTLFIVLGTSKNSIKAMMARRKYAKKRSLHVVNEHFEHISNAASVPSANF